MALTDTIMLRQSLIVADAETQSRYCIAGMRRREAVCRYSEGARLMAADMVKCPHCFGDKPAAAKVCVHCGRDEQGFGPMVRTSQTVLVSDSVAVRRRDKGDNLAVHMVLAALVTAIGFLLMLSSGLGALLFIAGAIWLGSTKARIWWRNQRN
jgi:hypothetical protein